MVQIQANQGLCGTCNNAPSCFFLASRGPALFCELFDNFVPPAARTGGAEIAPSTVSSLGDMSAEEAASTYTGLCMNCENRRTCRHPKPAGGVWHCEEYR